MSNDPATSSKATWVVMALLAAAVIAVAVLKTLPKRERAAAGECRAKLKSIGGLLQAWKGSHGGQFPPDLASLDSLARSAHPQRWMCPSDTEHSSYDFVFSQASSYDKSAVFVRCRRHGHICLADGSVPSAATKPNSE